jgi:hypothetical protein
MDMRKNPEVVQAMANWKKAVCDSQWKKFKLDKGVFGSATGQCIATNFVPDLYQ